MVFCRGAEALPDMGHARYFLAGLREVGTAGISSRVPFRAAYFG